MTSLGRSALNKILKPVALRLSLLYPLYTRYGPWPRTKLWVLDRLIEPYYQVHPRTFVTRTAFGCRISGDTNDVIYRYLFYYGVWEPTMTAWIRRRLARGDAFIDLGANIGYYSLLASRLVGPTGHVLAIEPSPEIFADLEHHLAINAARNVRAVRMAVSDRRETLRLYRGPACNRGLANTHLKIDDRSEMGSPSNFGFESEVEAAPLGEIARPDELQRARIIKIDCEGAEWAISLGLIPLLASTRHDLEIVAEVMPHYFLAQDRTPENLLRLYAEAGFHAYRLDTEFNHYNYVPSRLQTRFPRIRNRINQEMNVIFSRRDVEEIAL